jgi:hypothetical protein
MNNKKQFKEGSYHLLDVKNEGMCLGRWCSEFNEFEALFLDAYGKDDQGMMYSPEEINKISDKLEHLENDIVIKKEMLSHLSFYPFKLNNENTYRFGFYTEDGVFTYLKNDDDPMPRHYDSSRPQFSSIENVELIGSKIVFY